MEETTNATEGALEASVSTETDESAEDLGDGALNAYLRDDKR